MMKWLVNMFNKFVKESDVQVYFRSKRLEPIVSKVETGCDLCSS